MKPILYPAGETAFDTNGIGILADAVDCTVIEELNGQYELELQYPMKGIHFEDIDFRSIVLAKPNPVTEPQPFRIYRKTKPRNGIVTFYARHIAYDLMGVTVTPFSASNAPGALQALKDNAVTECPFAFWTDKTTAAAMSVKAPVSIWALLGGSAGSVLDLYGGEYEFDRWNVKLHGRRGADRGVSIRYGKNLTTFEQDANNADCYTGVHPYWLGTDGTLVQLSEKILAADGDYGYTKIMPLDLSQEWDTAPTEAQLRTRAQQYMKTNDIGTPTVSWKVEFVQLEQTEEYKGKALLERVLVGDTVSVYFPKMKVNASARAVAVRYKPILERYESITIGSVKANIADTIAKQQKQIHDLPGMTDVQRISAAATAWLTNGKGCKVERRDAAGNTIDTLYLDTPDISTAVNVLRVGQSGIGFSQNGVNGPYVSAWTIDGHFNADFIKTGTLDASLIRSGVLQSTDGKVKIDLANAGNEVVLNTGISTNGLHIRNDAEDAPTLFTLGVGEFLPGLFAAQGYLYSLEGYELLRFSEYLDPVDGSSQGLTVVAEAKNGDAYVQCTTGPYDTYIAVGQSGSDVRIGVSSSGPYIRLNGQTINLWQDVYEYLPKSEAES